MTNKEAAIKILRTLRRHGFEALFAGGCVRDMLLEQRAKDHDVATNAPPKEVTKLFKRTLNVGAKFGVTIVLIENQQVEVATFRTETDYIDGRHPNSVKFTTAAQDASRRDFTINGMFYDPLTKEVIDYVEGRADLRAKIVRTIGKPSERFSEDYLRMLRAVRFSTQLGFKIEPLTWSAICTHASKIAQISGERISIELEGILVNPNRSVGASMLFESGLAEAVFPGLFSKHGKTSIEVLSRLREKVNYPLALACLFIGCETDYAIEMSRALKISRNQTKHIKFLLTNRGILLDDRMSLANLKKILAKPYFWDLYEFQRAIQTAKGGTNCTAALENLTNRIKELGDVDLHPEPLLNGHDLIRLGAVPGPALGQLSEEFYIAQLEGQLKNSIQAEQWTRKWLQKHRDGN
ncbi:MAG: CCA tRNA nucleotidyltransferase [Sedimentisphaerales bacterium]|nr:CCA tRNA nucleotidyltransferase [Sedimentisphaerales bacterium]